MNAIMDLETLLRVPHVDPDHGFDPAPDGAQVAYAWNRSGQWEVYVAGLAGIEPPRQITAGPGARLAPHWSPAGDRLAYVRDLDGGELFDIWVYDYAQEAHVNLTPDTPDAIQPNFCWSPDGRWIAFASDRGGHFDTYVMPGRGGPARPVLALPNPDWDVRWSPDGRWLTVVTETTGQDSGVFIVSVEGGIPARPLANRGAAIPAREPCWSPDSERIAFSSSLHGYADIGIYEVGSGRIVWVTDGPGDKEEPAWSPDGARLAYVWRHGPVNELAVRGLVDSAFATYRVGPGIHGRPRFTFDGQSLLCTFASPGHPADLWRLDLEDGAFTQLTHSLPASLRQATFVLPEQIHYPGMDGAPVPALLYRPDRSAELPPAVVYIHGGPNWLSQVSWDPVVQHMVSRGWVVLAPNYRGSTGYGRAWQLASRFDLGGVDTDDVAAGAAYLAQAGLADPGRIALTGRSWGGYLTMTNLTRYPERWAAGCAVVPFLNWFTGHANSRKDLKHWDLENFGDPERDRDLYYERSPFFFLDRVAAPVQLICGAHDPRCPASESLQARDALAALGKSCDLALYADEGHVFLKTDNVVDAEKRRIAFLAAALEGHAGDRSQGSGDRGQGSGVRGQESGVRRQETGVRRQ